MGGESPWQCLEETFAWCFEVFVSEREREEPLCASKDESSFWFRFALRKCSKVIECGQWECGPSPFVRRPKSVHNMTMAECQGTRYRSQAIPPWCFPQTFPVSPKLARPKLGRRGCLLRGLGYNPWTKQLFRGEYFCHLLECVWISSSRTRSHAWHCITPQPGPGLGEVLRLGAFEQSNPMSICFRTIRFLPGGS